MDTKNQMQGVHAPKERRVAKLGTALHMDARHQGAPHSALRGPHTHATTDVWPGTRRLSKLDTRLSNRAKHAAKRPAKRHAREARI